MLSLKEIKNHPGVLECIRKSEQYLDSLGYTDHGMRHLNMVADRARSIAKKIGLGKKEQEKAAIAGFCHDMGNFLQRSNHCYTGAMLFSQFFIEKAKDKSTVLEIMQAISNHDEHKFEIISKIGAILILADKSDVHRTRVKDKSPENIKADIHDRVNYSVTNASFKVDNKTKNITLKLKVDTKVTAVMEYFEIFNERMILCRKAAEFIDYNFVLIINNFKLS